jgi:hypothetical protein
MNRKKKIFFNDLLFCFLVGIKLALLDHHARIVFNNVKQLFLKRYKVAMPNKRSNNNLLTIVNKISNYLVFLSTSLLSIVYYCLRFIVIIWQLIKKKNKTKQKKMKHSHDRIYFFDIRVLKAKQKFPTDI